MIAILKRFVVVCGVALSALCLAMPVTATTAHDLGHVGSPVADGEHHHHDGDGSLVSLDEFDPNGDEKGHGNLLGHDHQAGETSTNAGITTDRPHFLTIIVAGRRAVSRHHREPAAFAPDPHIEPPRFA